MIQKLLCQYIKGNESGLNDSVLSLMCIFIYMALTTHQLLHLNALIRECDESTLLPIEERGKLSKAKKVDESKYLEYLDELKKEVEKMIQRENFPPEIADTPSRIHDYLEKGSIRDKYKES